MKSHFEPKLAFTLKESAKIIFGSDSRSDYQKVLRLDKNKVIESITFPGNGGRVYVTRKALMQLMGDDQNFESLLQKISK